MAVAIVVDEGATGIPALETSRGSCRYARFIGYIRECAIAVITPKRAIAPITDEEIFMPVVVIVAGAHALAPTGPRHACLRRNVGERAVAVVLVEAADRLLTFRERGLKTRAVYKEQVEPAVIIVIKEGDAAAGGFEQKLVLLFGSKDRFRIETGFARYIDELDAKRKAGYKRIEREHGNRGA